MLTGLLGLNDLQGEEVDGILKDAKDRDYFFPSVTAFSSQAQHDGVEPHGWSTHKNPPVGQCSRNLASTLV